MIVLADAPELAAEQLRAIIYYLTTLAYVDGEYHDHERRFVAARIHKLVANQVHYRRGYESAATRTRLIQEQTEFFTAVAADIDREVQSLYDEAVLTKEGREAHVRDKLELRCYEVLRSFDAEARAKLLEICDELILADGVEHPAEKRFRQEIDKLLASSALEDGYATEALPPLSLRIAPASSRRARTPNDDFFSRLERPYPTETAPLRKEAAADKKLIQAALAQLERQRKLGEGKLDGIVGVDELQGQKPFLDRFVYALPAAPDQRLDLTVFGDLHGCYSCLKAAVLQCDFLGKLEAWRKHPEREPEPKLVFLGDYVDRGLYSYEGVLRAALSLFVHAPEQVYLLRGNHEHYRLLKGKVAPVVSPAEAIDVHGKLLPHATLLAYKDLFEQLPSVLLFNRIVMVHAGIPRDVLLEERYEHLGSLNDSILRFEMAWSDPSTADHVPAELQAKSSRFAFGRRQFHRFLARLGANVMIRGHEVAESGFRTIYDDGRSLLLNIFSAGGAMNDDLPPTSPYRRLAPAALTLAHAEGRTTATPWAIDYEPYVVPGGNNFYAHVPFAGFD